MRQSITAPDIRTRNLRSVFELARRQGEVQRPEISRETGLTPPTVMKAVQLLVERKMLIESGEVETALGRKPVRLVFNPSAALAVGVVFEGEDMHAGLVDLAGGLIGRQRLPVHNAFNGETIEAISRCVCELVESASAPVLGIGLGVPGVVDAIHERIEFAPLIGITEPGDCAWACRRLEQATRLPVFLENDVNATASGEFFIRRLESEDDLLYVSVGTGIGAGIMLNGKLRRGARNLAGELGYAVSHDGFPVDRSKPGWLENQIGLEALKRRYKWDGAASVHPFPEEVVSHVGDHLAPIVANMANQLDIRLIVLGGLAFDLIGEPLFHELSKRICRLSLEPCSVEMPACDEPGIIGAAVLAFERRLDSWLSEAMLS